VWKLRCGVEQGELRDPRGPRWVSVVLHHGGYALLRGSAYAAAQDGEITRDGRQVAHSRGATVPYRNASSMPRSAAKEGGAGTEQTRGFGWLAALGALYAALHQSRWYLSRCHPCTVLERLTAIFAQTTALNLCTSNSSICLSSESDSFKDSLSGSLVIVARQPLVVSSIASSRGTTTCVALSRPYAWHPRYCEPVLYLRRRELHRGLADPVAMCSADGRRSNVMHGTYRSGGIARGSRGSECACYGYAA
jgi:hypothetical protein